VEFGLYCVCLLASGWTLGAVLYENSRIQHDCERRAAADAAGDNDDEEDEQKDYDVRVMLSRLLIVGQWAVIDTEIH